MKGKGSGRKRLRWLLGCGCIAGGVVAWGWLFPYGSRPCVMPCLMTGLMSYAADHGGWFPDGGGSGIQSLRLLVPNYVSSDVLAGLSGDRRQLLQELESGNVLSEKASSLVYWGGFRWDDDPQLAVVWDRTPGVNGNGRRAWPGSHAVGYADGRVVQVPARQWSQFLKAQAELRARLYKEREKRGAMATSVE